MTKCTDSGCRNLQTTCADCGRVVCTKTFTAPGEWINIKDKLPDFYEKILVSCGGDIHLGRRIQGEEINPSGSILMSSSDGGTLVTHWKPLPKPPEEK